MSGQTSNNDGKACVAARAAPVYEGMGWTHYVDIANTCDAAVECEVFTDVDPQPRYRVVVPARDSVRFRTRAGSPQSYFRAGVHCRFRG